MIYIEIISLLSASTLLSSECKRSAGQLSKCIMLCEHMSTWELVIYAEIMWVIP